MRYLILLICILCLFACARTIPDNRNIIIEQLPNIKNLTSERLTIPPILLRPVKTCIVDSFLIVAQSRPDSIYSIFQLPDCKYLMSFGIKGRGPNEFLNSSHGFTLAPVYSDQGSFAVDNMRNNIQYYRINDIMQNYMTPYKIEELPSTMDGFQTIGYFYDTIIIAAPWRLKMLLLKYHSINKKIDLFKGYPNVYSFDDLMSLRNQYTGCITVKQDNSKFALAYGTKGIIEIYSINDTIPITISYKGFPSLEENLGLRKDSKFSTFSKDEMIFCWGISSTNRYIYAKIYNDKYFNISDGKGLLRSYIAEIHVFDWSGKLVTRLKPDNFYTEFVVDKNDKYLYTIDENVENIVSRVDLQKTLPD
jgi:hypothetical protein